MQTSRDVDPGFCKRVQFSHQGRWVHDHSRPYHCVFAGTQNSAGDQLEYEAVSVEDDGMAGIVASRASRDVIERRGKIVHDLALPFIAPLRTYDQDRLHRQIAPARIRIPNHETKRVKTMLTTHAAGLATRLRATP